ncbi:MAG: hypothetical protein K2X87_29620 [Gemmataceae bacterium]|nr:hypothetical protein [Gemmataceae bacterium]
MSRFLVVALAAFTASRSPVPHAAADDKVAPVPKEVRALAGTYTGAWALYGIDAKGEVVKKMAWTDTMTAADPEVKGDRAQVSTVDEMAFEGAKGPPFKVPGKEGYFLTKDGKLGDYFIETFGQVQRLVKLADNVWTAAAPAAEQELTRLGFPKGAAGQHVLVKVVTREAGVETHRISRVTMASWTDQDGKERTVQFVSLRGHHKRKP